MNPVLATLAVIGAVGCVLAIVAAARSRHKKAGTGQLRVMGATGFVNTKLNPEGTILVDGELWRARSQNGMLIDHRNQVIVTEMHGHFLLVEPASCNEPSASAPA